MNGIIPAGRVKFVDSKEGVDVAEVCSDGGDIYDLVRRSDGAIAGSLKLKSGDRVLLNVDGFDIAHKHLQMDERVTSRDTLVEIIKELSASI